jgi:hypothetical protein
MRTPIGVTHKNGSFMKKFYIGWFIAVTLFALVGAGVQSSAEWIHMRDEADGSATTLLDTLTTLDYSVQSSDRKIAKLMERLRKLRAPSDEFSSVAGLAICSPSSKNRGFPLGQGWEQTCQNSVVETTLRTLKDGSWTSMLGAVGSRKLKFYTRAVVPQEDAAAGDTPKAYVLVQDVSMLQTRWLSSLTRFFKVT